MTLTATEFLRRSCLHFLPTGFVRIRHFGFLANSLSRFPASVEPTTPGFEQRNRRAICNQRRAF